MTLVHAPRPAPIQDELSKVTEIQSKAAVQRMAIHLWKTIQVDLSKVGNSPMDDFDQQEYRRVLVPLVYFMVQSRNPEPMTLAEVWQVRVAIRNSEFRPTYERLEEIVNKAIARVVILLSGAEIEARQIRAVPPADVSGLLEPGPSDHLEDCEPLPGVTLAPNPRLWRREQFPSGRAYFLALKKAYNAETDQSVTTRTVEDAKNYPLRPGASDPLKDVPVEHHEELLAEALTDLKKRGKGRHPVSVREWAAALYRTRQPTRQPTRRTC